MLRIEGLSLRFGGLYALQDVSFEQRAGGIYGLIGPNGAGKTSLLNIVSGMYPPTAGAVWWKDERLDGRPPHEIAARAVARTFQNIELFGKLTVLENVLVGRHLHVRPSWWSPIVRPLRDARREREARERAMALLSAVGLARYADRRAASLPFPLQRLLEIARAMAIEPEFLLLDEPSAGMTSEEIAQLEGVIRGFHAGGALTILLVAHTMSLIRTLCEHVVVLDQGHVIAAGSPAEVMVDEQVVSAYMGEDHARIAPETQEQR